MKTVYTYRLKSIECPSCGGPVVTDPSSSRTQCGFCNASLDLRPRRKETDEHTDIDEAARMAGLWAQMLKPDPESPLLYRVPSGLESFAAMIDESQARKAGLSAVREAWEHTRARMLVDSTPDREDTIRLFRLAILLSHFYQAEDDHEHARAVLESALELCSEPGQRNILRCRLARAALDTGDEEAFHAWIADCNPRPIYIEADTEIRIAQALRHLRAGAHYQILDVLGRRAEDVPIALADVTLARLLRAHAYAGLGDAREAKTALREIMRFGTDPAPTLRRLLRQFPGPAGPYVEEVLTAPAAPITAAPSARPATTVTAAPDAKVALRAIKSIGCVIFVTTVLPIFAGMCLPLMFTTSLDVGGSTEPYTAAVALAEACPAAVAALGNDISWAPGWSCGNCETSNGSGDMSWTTRVSGTIDSGTLSFDATRSGGVWQLRMATLETAQGNIDLMQCAGPGGVTEGPKPGSIGALAPATPGTPGAANIALGMAQQLGAQCDSGQASICIVVGAMYQQGNGVPRDLAQARRRFQQACDMGEEAGCHMLRELPAE